MFLEELYSPMLDAKCFNDRYDPPSPNKHELYRDYKKIFDWGLKNPSGSPLFAGSTGVTANRFPSMCLRMSFHDNAINGKDGAEYVKSMIDSAGQWTGPDLLMETSGGDASVLTCKPERYHPNNNYDQTASRVLHAFQSSEAYPKGPGIGYGHSLMSKYRMSYADALHNCALAAIKYMTEPDDSSVHLEFNIDDSEREAIKSLYHEFSFGRKDACYVTDKVDLVFNEDGLGANSRRPLCGPTEILPGVTLKAKGVFNWFESRGLPVGVWLSLFGSHTALDNFSDPKNIRYFGLPDEDYFEDYVGCPFHKLLPPVVEPEDTGCEWRPNCKNPYSTKQEEWFLVQSDCATSIDLIQAAQDPDLELLEKQMQIYIDNPGSWIPDIVCALKHLGGNNADCVGPYGITSPKTSLFGSFWKNDYPEPRILTCDYKCPENSSRGPDVLCLQSFDDCVCAQDYIVDETTGNTCIEDPAIKYKDCTDRGYSLEYCQDKYGRLRRHLTQVDTRSLGETYEDCLDEEYDMYLVIHGVHFAGLATPVDSDSCPSLVFHAESYSSSDTLDKQALEATDEIIAEIEEDDKLHLGVKPLSDIVDAFEQAPVGKEGILYDAISNNCISMLRNMADPLEIAVDERMVSFISTKLMDGRSDHMFEMMKNSPSLQKLFNGGRRILASLSDEDLLNKVIALYV